MTTTEQLLAAALDLPVEERDRLVDALLASMDEESSLEQVKARLFGAG